MDPNFAGNRDFTSSNKFGNDGGGLFSDLNEWDLQGHFRELSDLTASYPFYGSDADPFGFPAFTGLNPEGPEPLVSFPRGSTVEAGAASDSSPFGTAASVADASVEDTDFLENARYISQILMEENFEDMPCMYYDPMSLQDTEKSFSEVLQEKLPLSPNQHPLDIHQNLERTIDSPGNSNSTSTSTSSSDNIHLNSQDFKALSPETPVSGDSLSQFDSQSISHIPTQLELPQHTLTSISHGFLDLDSSVSKLLAQNIFSDADSILQFKRGLEEASKFLPPGPQLFTGLESHTESVEGQKGDAMKADVPLKLESSHDLKSRKNHERQGDDGEEGRCNKHSAIVEEESELSDMFDQVLLSIENVPLSTENQDGSVTDTKPTEQPHSSEGAKTRSKKKGRKKATVDLRNLLVLCAQAVSAGDQRTANELLKQIRQHSTVLGDASQRLAHFFANGLEARLAGTSSGTHTFYASLSYKKLKLSAADFLKAYQVFISACPFKKLAHFFANKMILKTAEKAETLHIIDFGILYGFQWPILIKFLSKRNGGPPKLRITGIEYPQAGFRPTERIEETGHRLANYCERFGVPFEYKAIASRNWETIQIEELNIKSNEVLAVNCLVRFKNVLDETVEVNSPRNAVLSLIRRINPDIFTQAALNGSFNAPFFVSRFREALFHYSTIYDMYDTLISRENKWRLLIEREFLGREIMNVIACEGFERVERPESYKQWHVRNSRAGFRQLPLDKELMAKFRERITEWYQHHKDFVLDEDNNWMLQGWKGRILYASTCWVPA